MTIQLSNCKRQISGTVQLPTSKSISNRVLIINALSYSPYPIQDLSDSDDSKVLEAALYSNTNHFDIGHAGTAMRFLTTYLSKIVGEWTITGSQRMQERPIGILVDALRELGAKIEYQKNEGFPPLKIFGSHLKGKTIKLNGAVSSQFITALLLIAPTVENGLTLQLTGEVTSRSYIEMTLKIMQHFGIQHKWEDNQIIVPEQKYLPLDYSVEADWSGASYFYELLSLAESGEILLKGLQVESLQGDSIIAQWCRQFGIQSTQQSDGVLLQKKQHTQPNRLELDFKNCPDIAQTMVCLSAGLKIPFNITGLKTLKIKETDRIKALQNELAKFGVKLSEPAHGMLSWNGVVDKSLIEKLTTIKTYNDHRMAMAFAPLALFHDIKIENETVVSKSYTHFWKDFKTICQ